MQPLRSRRADAALSVSLRSDPDAALGSMRPLGRRRGAVLFVKLSGGNDQSFGHASFCYNAGQVSRASLMETTSSFCVMRLCSMSSVMS